MPKNAEARRELCIRRIREIHDLSLQAATDTAVRANFFAHYPSVAKLAEDFKNAHLKIIQETAEFEAEDVIRAKFDKMHYAVKSRYHLITGAPHGNAQTQPAGHSSAVKLPKIALPQFSGDLSLWPSFIALYNTSIHENRQLSAIEKYQYLLASLKGEALNVIKNLPFSSDHYMTAYDSLLSRYRNKRKLADYHLNSMLDSKPLKTESAEALRNLLDAFSENTRALSLMKFPTDSWDFLLLKFLLDKLPRSLREKFESAHRTEEIPRYNQLTKFLSEHCKVLEAIAGPSTLSNKSKSASVSSFVTHTADCPVCKEQHYISKCPRFLKLSPRERQSTARDSKLCLNCLRPGHGMNNCPSAWTCRTCGVKHHTLLHFDQSANSDSTPASVTAPPVILDSANAPQSEDKPIVTMASLANRVVLISTVRVEVIDAYGNALPVRVLLDSASQANFITEGCLQRGGFRRTKHSATVFAVNETKAATTRGLTSFVICARGWDDTRFSIEATVLSRITSTLPNDKVEVRSWNHLKGLPLADPEYCVPGSIDILLGVESFVSVLRDGRRKGRKGESDAFNTIFGWVLTGAISSTVQSAPLRSFATTLESIERSVSNLGQLDEVPEHAPCSEEDRRCKEIFAKTTYRDHSGRFVVLYPFASDPPTFVDSRSIAVSRLRALERRFKSNPEFRIGYNKFMQDYLDSGHMEVIRDPFPSDGHIYYLPHHGVYKLDSTTTKLRERAIVERHVTQRLVAIRVVFSGPKLQQDLLAILIRFRAEPVALTADVKQMFRQVWINPEQCDYQRIVWRFSESDPILDYILKTVTFGLTCSPFLAIYCLLQLATLHREEYPLAFAALFEALYVDDVVVSVRTVEQARALRDQLYRFSEAPASNSENGRAAILPRWMDSTRSYVTHPSYRLNRAKINLLKSWAFGGTHNPIVSDSSDCGTNFVGAARKLETHMSLAAEREKIKWTFNPPSAPHFGGLWESGVKSFKTHLRRVVGDQVLSIEEFTTVLAQIEAVLNSRPLCPVSTDPSDLEVLSSGHFLTMEPLEYLTTLQQRPKWWTSVNQIVVGSLVLIKDANLSPLRWRRGRVEALHPGSNGVPRVATVRVADGSLGILHRLQTVFIAKGTEIIRSTILLTFLSKVEMSMNKCRTSQNIGSTMQKETKA
ncbi:uncharacterized protein [Temnothorax nylanderi]|uniref:uncharacterized protein n=1 Tax=Temnothorax nylanderi TaxID=102681 RepID=UPI003A8C22B6